MAILHHYFRRDRPCHTSLDIQFFLQPSKHACASTSRSQQHLLQFTNWRKPLRNTLLRHRTILCVRRPMCRQQRPRSIKQLLLCPDYSSTFNKYSIHTTHEQRSDNGHINRLSYDNSTIPNTFSFNLSSRWCRRHDINNAKQRP